MSFDSITVAPNAPSFLYAVVPKIDFPGAHMYCIYWKWKWNWTHEPFIVLFISKNHTVQRFTYISIFNILSYFSKLQNSLSVFVDSNWTSLI